MVAKLGMVIVPSATSRSSFYFPIRSREVSFEAFLNVILRGIEEISCSSKTVSQCPSLLSLNLLDDQYALLSLNFKMVQVWYMNDSDEDQRLPHHKNPPDYIDLKELYRRTGVEYFKVNEKDSLNDALLIKLKRERNYSYEDEITCSEECLPNYEEKLRNFFTEHLHTDEEIRLVLEGSGYFDVRDAEDKWIRISVCPGDLIIIPAGIYHRFTLDEKNYIKAKRYFIGEPVWTPHNRPADDMPCRQQYLSKVIKGF